VIPPLRRVLSRDGAELNPALGSTARLQVAFGALFAVGVLLG
jgi:1,4-dihydroxy-2-naphthoate octaprenyltransferase